jgi:hypothetical protein
LSSLEGAAVLRVQLAIDIPLSLQCQRTATKYPFATFQLDAGQRSIWRTLDRRLTLSGQRWSVLERVGVLHSSPIDSACVCIWAMLLAHDIVHKLALKSADDINCIPTVQAYLLNLVRADGCKQYPALDSP